MRRFHVLLLVTALVATACGGSEPQPTPQSLFQPALQPMPSANVLFSSTDLALGTGATAVAGKRLTVHYTGWLYDGSSSEQKGRQFESTFGKKPLSFVLGQGEIIQGGERGVEGMNVGGRRRVVIPPDLAFGDAGDRGNVPPNATLIYEVELIGVQ